MRHALSYAFAGFAILVLPACATRVEPAAPLDPPHRAEVTASSLVGTWDVALLFDADAPPSSTVLEITAANEGGTLEGSFYFSTFETGRYRRVGESIAITVMTSDGSGPYITSGRLGGDGQFEGQTLSTGRDFLMTWTAEPAD